jgi:hypothetical protein
MDMKPFENCKVAVCFSGQSRTFKYCAESINNFFSSDRNNQYYFFGHTTNKNYFKLPSGILSRLISFETLDTKVLSSEINECFAFKKLLIEEEMVHPIRFGAQLYSQMKSNYLKQQFEIENNMMFDVVIRARFDTCYPNNTKFEHFIDFLIEEKTLYANYGIMRNEFVLPNPSQIFHFGSSLTMDLVDSIYNVLITKAFHKLIGHNQFNPMWEKVGDGALLHKWCTIRNILPKQFNMPLTIIRNHSINLDYKTEWDKVCRAGWFLE